MQEMLGQAEDIHVCWWQQIHTCTKISHNTSVFENSLCTYYVLTSSPDQPLYSGRHCGRDLTQCILYAVDNLSESLHVASPRPIYFQLL
jgi:hypothetical protein